MNQVVMPKMGITMESAKIVAWHKKVGEEVKQGEELFEIETEKSQIPVESAYTGILKEIIVQEGEEAPVDAVLAIIE
jgi:pyruvate dehydrogenase E2 component (dihydrolipoamide acetyltransferase)